MLSAMQKQRLVARRLAQSEHPTLLRSVWVDYNQFLITPKQLQSETWDDDGKNYSGCINTNTDSLN